MTFKQVVTNVGFWGGAIASLIGWGAGYAVGHPYIGLAFANLSFGTVGVVVCNLRDRADAKN